MVRRRAWWGYLKRWLETVTWVLARNWLRPVVPWEETRAQLAARASRCVRAINSEYNAKGLCAEFPGRLRKCMENEGERLAK